MNGRAREALPGVLLGLILFLVPTLAVAQEEEDPPPIQEDSVQLVFEREIFSYPGYARRNPFRPLTGPDDVGPRFNQMAFMGGIVTDDPSTSVALVGVGGGDDARTHRLRVGDRLGNVRILEIHERQLVVEVEEFGLTERRTMDLRRSEPRAQGSSAEDEPPLQDDTTTPPPDTIPPAGGSDGEDSGAEATGAGSGADAGTNGNGGD